MNNFREVNDDILRDWLSFREEMVLGTLTKEDRKHYIYFDEITENILKNVPKQNQKYVKNQLDRLDKNFMDYICYWNEKYYRNGSCDGVQLIIGCIDKQLKLIQSFFKTLKKLWILNIFFKLLKIGIIIYLLYIFL